MEKIDELVARLALDSQAVRLAPNPFKLSGQLTGAAILYLAISLAFSGVRPDWQDKIHNVWFIAEIVALFAVFLFTSLSAALLGFPDQYQKRNLVFAPIGLFALFLLILLFSARVEQPLTTLPIHSFQCTIGITLMALLPAAWTYFALRNYASTHYRLAGSVALLSAFSVGALWLRLHEETDSISHVFVWHYLPMLVIGLIGLWLGKILLKW